MLPPGILQQLNMDRFVALDLETTGLNSDYDDIIEFGAARYVDGTVEEERKQWQFTDGRPMPWFNWQATDPNYEYEKNIAIHSRKNVWIDLEGPKFKIAFVCEWDSIDDVPEALRN